MAAVGGLREAATAGAAAAIAPRKVLGRSCYGGQSGRWGGHADDVLCVAHCPPQMLASGGYDGTVILWSLDMGCPKVSRDDVAHRRRSRL